MNIDKNETNINNIIINNKIMNEVKVVTLNENN